MNTALMFFPSNQPFYLLISAVGKMVHFNIRVWGGVWGRKFGMGV